MSEVGGRRPADSPHRAEEPPQAEGPQQAGDPQPTENPPQEGEPQPAGGQIGLTDAEERFGVDPTVRADEHADEVVDATPDPADPETGEEPSGRGKDPLDGFA